MPQESADASWQYDYIDGYRLDEKIINGFLETIWGEHKYFVKRRGDQFRFWVPRALEEREKDALADLRKSSS